MAGLRAWLVQRVTAIVILGLLLLFFVFDLTESPFKTFEAWTAWVNSPLISIMIALFFGALLFHAWVGLRDIILDYVHTTVLRLFFYSLVAIGYSSVGFWVIRILMR
ncbi:succinate dehydrogenase hydrophobic membrane anchor protein [Candidatus Nitrosoglobus terrae]|uniref:Succinate dehydrogenase hydrophobic membrane anchor subunit n=2 Tax=Candidatus Nitrosoglobus terrae TaxID=1630141 RepID=A0A1Q2SP11_9GAMM|nr:succinate dehydrogenase hydrophobic membrane anchor protein [Candidatus Nitrosoglobus terrae]